MAKNELIDIWCLGKEVGRLGFDEDKSRSSFQYNPAFLNEGRNEHMFPPFLRRMEQTQVFAKYAGDTFKNLPPVFADSLPDMFGNIVFKTWLEANNKDFGKITVLEQLAYVGKRGMGALEYMPAKEVKGTATIDINSITAVVEEVINNKNAILEKKLDHNALLNIFKIGSSAGGARPKILVSENKATGQIVPGDVVVSDEYTHYLVKLGIAEDIAYSREVLEYVYYLTATAAGINMMPAKLINNKHLALERFDRQNGEKVHVLTATGLSGYDYKDPAVSTYENLFALAVYYKVPHADIEQLFRRMVFNLVFFNHDDHLKNHSFIYEPDTDSWHLSPAYDITYSLNPDVAFTKVSRALSINGKRTGINIADIMAIAGQFTIRNARGIVDEVCAAIPKWIGYAESHALPERIAKTILKDFKEY